MKALVNVNKLEEASFDIFTYHGEDGIIFYLASLSKGIPPTFVDIGSGDCIKSNCSTLAVHFGWEGLFIDKDKKQLDVGKRFYQRKRFEGSLLEFVQAEITEENVNQVLRTAGFNEGVGLLSIDIDGNDYWIWKAIECIQPEIVVIEAKVEFGLRNLVVPYGKNNHHGADKMYNGASVEAIRLLGMKKGYKLAGANKQGYNLFFVRSEYPVPETTSSDILNNPDIISSFYPDIFFETHKFERG